MVKFQFLVVTVQATKPLLLIISDCMISWFDVACQLYMTEMLRALSEMCLRSGHVPRGQV